MPLSPSATRELLARLGHTPKRFLGQNFLVDGNIVRKSLELAEVTTGDAIVEVGPGLGTLTKALLSTGANVWAVERDATLYAHLTTTLAQEFPDTLHLKEGDALEYPLAGLPAERAANETKNEADVGSGGGGGGLTTKSWPICLTRFQRHGWTPYCPDHYLRAWC